MNKSPITQDDLILLSCAELEAERADEVREALAAEAGLAAEARAVETAMKAIASEAADLPEDFEARFRCTIEDQMKPHAPSRRSWFRAILAPLSAVAAMILLALVLWPAPGSGKNSSVAWADVARAVQKVSQFHITMFADEPRNADSPKMYRVDLFHQAPDGWRVHGFDHVGIRSGDSEKLYDIVHGKFVDPQNGRYRLLDPEIMRGLRQENLLNGILSLLFRGKVPPGEPVKSDQVAASEGVEVFDYATNPSQRWARIWVMKQSKLPIRMNIYQPQSDDFQLVVFDYSDPQPDAFFDADHFEKEVTTKNLRDAHDVYSVGTTPVAGTRPRSSDQIYVARGGYKAPTVRSITRNDVGDLQVVTSNIRNEAPSGARVHDERFDSVTDNWGNRYIACGGSTAAGENNDWFLQYAPAPPFKKGSGQQVVTLVYALTEISTIENHSQFETKVIDRVQIEVKPDANAGGCDPQIKQTVIAHFMRQTAPLARQLALIDETLARQPHALPVLLWKFNLLLDYGREEQAWEFFDKKLLHVADTFPSKTYVISSDFSEALGRYLFHLARLGRLDDVKRIIQQVRSNWEKIKASGDRSLIQEYEYCIENEHYTLHQALKIPEFIAEFDAIEKPKVARIVASKDGYVMFELSLPPVPQKQAEYLKQFGEADRNVYWTWHGIKTSAPGSIVADLHSSSTNTYRRIIRNPGAKLTLTGSALASVGNAGRLYRDWVISVDTPAATVEELQDLYAADSKATTNESWQVFDTKSGSPFEQLRPEARTAFDLHDYAKALALWQQAAQLPQDQWPDYFRGPLNVEMASQIRRDLELDIARCLARLGRIDEAKARIAAVEKPLPPLDALEETSIAAWRSCRSARLEVVRCLMDAHRLDDARTELGAIEATRPDLADLTDRMTTRQKGRSYTMLTPRSAMREAWKEFDLVKWDVMDAQRQ